jgi:NAD(P)-dependent dehydrogenase (short-subunit alcohol dehydrogenase family)
MTEQNLSGRVAVVTGAGTGLGTAIAYTLADSGADVLLHYRGSAEAVEILAADCRNRGRRAETYQADFAANPGLAADLVDAAARLFGRIDILVNNAAVTTKNEPFETHRRGLFEEILDVNVVAPFLASQAAARHMIAAGRGGRIINIGSVHGRMAVPTMTAYETSKGAIAALTFSTAIALGPHGITVNCVAPGAILVERYADLDWDEEWFVSRTPVGRMGRPDDIASMVRFLASDEAGFITGETIYVDGGMTRRMPLAK